MFNVPSYSRWLDTAPRDEVYRHHRRVLQTLQWTYPAQRWLLKSPAHIEAIGSLLRVYPDACVIQTHRDPVKSVPSYASLCETFRAIWTRSIDRVTLGQQVQHQLASDLERGLAQRAECDPRRFVDVQYRDLTQAPLDTIRAIYDHFALVLSPEAEQRMQDYLAEQRERLSAHRYALEDFGLTAERLRRRFSRYIDAFAIPQEAAAEQHSTARSISATTSGGCQDEQQ